MAFVTLFDCWLNSISNRPACTRTPELCATTCVGRTPSLTCWGIRPDGLYGVLDVPANLTSSISEVSLSGEHACAITPSTSPNSFMCWGNNTHGQVTPPSWLHSASQITVGMGFSCALTTDSPAGITFWGLNDAGQSTVPLSIINRSKPWYTSHSMDGFTTKISSRTSSKHIFGGYNEV